MSDLQLGYRATRGRAQVLRHLLSYANQQFTQKQYKSTEEYQKDRQNLGDFPNIPYLRDGDFVLTQTIAIARYIVRRANRQDLLGQSLQDIAHIDNFIYALNEIMQPLLPMFYNKKVNDIKAGHYYKIKSSLERFDRFAQGKDTIMGYVTIADFFLAEYSYYIEKLYPEEFPNFRNLIIVREYIMSLPDVQAYYERDNAIKTPFLPPENTAIQFYWPGTEPKGTVYKKTFLVHKKVAQINNNQSQKAQQTEVQQNFDQQIEFHNSGNVFKVAVISGSVSGNSPLNYFLGAITNIGHPCFTFQWCDISQLQLHNEDIDQGTDNANYLRGQIYECSAVLIAVAQTNGLISTALTNAYNWLVPVLKERAVGLVSVQSSEEALRKAFDKEGIPYLKSAKLSISSPETFFNQEGGIDGQSLNRVKKYFNQFAIFMETGQ